MCYCAAALTSTGQSFRIELLPVVLLLLLLLQVSRQPLLLVSNVDSLLDELERCAQITSLHATFLLF
jgi:hypothetical protein